MIAPNCQSCKHYEKPMTHEPCKECTKTARDKQIVASKFEGKVIMDNSKKSFSVEGAGTVIVGGSTKWRCGKAKGVTFDISWSRYGTSGGVMDKADVIKLRDHLNTILTTKGTK